MKVTHTSTRRADLEKLPGFRDPAAVKDVAQAAALLVAAMTTTRDPYVLKILAKGLLSVSWSLGDKEAFTLYAQAMAKTHDPYALRLLARGLTAVAARLKFDDMKPIFMLAVKDSKSMETGKAMLLSLSEIAGQMDVKSKLKVSYVTAFLTALENMKTKDPFIFEGGAKAMAAMARHVEQPKELIPTLSASADRLLEEITKTREPYGLEALAEGLSALVETRELKEAVRWSKPAVASLVKRFAEVEDPYALAALARALSVLAARLPPDQATAPAAVAARALTRCMAESKDSYALEALATGLSEVSPFLNRADAARLAADAAVLARAMTENRDLIKRSGLAGSFANLFARLEVPELVGLLGRPLCAGPARRLVLDQLGKRYKRKLADHWEFVRFAGEQHIPLDTPAKGS